jgi:outer membrane immunogenic protein
MKKILLASVGLIALGVASASAADIQRRAMPVKAPEIVTPIYNWTGPYIGIQAGGGWGHSDFSGTFPGSANTSGGLVGGTLGYNWQINQMVVGLETDIAWSNIRGSSACGVGFSCETKNNWLGTTRARLGLAYDRFMPYVTGGFAYGGLRGSVNGVGSSSGTKGGWTVGGGLEAAISGPWTAKIEYLYVDLGNVDTTLGGQANFKTNIVRAGLNYRF